MLVRMLGKLIASMEVAMDRVVVVLKFRVQFRQM